MKLLLLCSLFSIQLLADKMMSTEVTSAHAAPSTTLTGAVTGTGTGTVATILGASQSLLGSLNFDIDSDSNGTNTFIVSHHTGTPLLTLTETGAMTILGDYTAAAEFAVTENIMRLGVGGTVRGYLDANGLYTVNNIGTDTGNIVAYPSTMNLKVSSTRYNPATGTTSATLTASTLSLTGKDLSTPATGGADDLTVSPGGTLALTVAETGDATAARDVVGTRYVTSTSGYFISGSGTATINYNPSGGSAEFSTYGMRLIQIMTTLPTCNSGSIGMISIYTSSAGATVNPCACTRLASTYSWQPMTPSGVCS